MSGENTDIDAIVRGLSKGARRACVRMTTEPQFPGKATFDANGAWALYQSRTGSKRRPAEYQLLTDGKYKRAAYNLTDLGTAVRARLIEEGESNG